MLIISTNYFTAARVSTRVSSMEHIDIDAARIPLVRKALADAHASDVRHAERHGNAIPVAPTLDVVTTWAQLECPGCESRGSAFEVSFSAPDGKGKPRWALSADGWLTPCCDLPPTRADYARVSINCERPTLGDYELLACIEPMPLDHEGNPSPNMVKRVPGSTTPIPESYRTGDAQTCDHCRVKRNRTETFLVAGHGRIWQVGRSCLAAFLGDTSYELIVRRLAWDLEIARALDEDGSSGGRGITQLPAIETVLALTAASIRCDGWVSRKSAELYDKCSTSNHVNYLVSPPSPMGMAAWRAEHKRVSPGPADLHMARETLTWARALAPSSEYEHSLRTACMQAGVAHMGITCSAVSAYQRAQGIEQARKLKVPSVHYGAVGDKIGGKVGKGKNATVNPPFLGVIERITVRENDFGVTTLIVARGTAPGAPEGSTLLQWWHSGALETDEDWRVGDTVAMTGTIKKHDAYHSENQTVMTRCTIRVVSRESDVIETWPTADETTELLHAPLA